MGSTSMPSSFDRRAQSWRGVWRRATLGDKTERLPCDNARGSSKHGFSTVPFAPEAKDTGFAEPGVQNLGREESPSLDASDFEGAEVVHDLNQPLPEQFKGRFDLVYDGGGTLEHVFELSRGIEDCMEMLRTGGQMIVHTGANNWCGHGFYHSVPSFFPCLQR